MKKAGSLEDKPGLKIVEILEENQLDIDLVKSYLEGAHTALTTKITKLKAAEAELVTLVKIEPEKKEALRIIRSRISKLEFLAKNVEATINNANNLQNSPSENRIPESLKWRIGMLHSLAGTMKVNKMAQFFYKLFKGVTNIEKSTTVCE